MHIRWRGLELPSVVDCDAKTLSSTYGKFTAEPFERGFGVTVGNSLRRILLSSLEGSAVTQIKVRGAQHEFTTIPGVLEDMTDIVLNVKSLVVKNHSDATRVITVEKSEPGVDHRRRCADRRRRGGDQQGSRPGDADRQRPVHDGNGRRERARLRAGRRAEHRATTRSGSFRSTRSTAR